MSTVESTLTPQQTHLLEQIAANCKPGKGFKAASCFLGTCIMDATQPESPLDPQIIESARRKTSALVTNQFPGTTMTWLDDAHGIGFLTKLEEDVFRRVAEALQGKCRFDVKIWESTVPIGIGLACTWFAPTLQAAPRFLLDTAEQLLHKPREQFGLDFVAVHSQEDVIAALGGRVNLFSDLGVSQEGGTIERRIHERIPLKLSCLLRYLQPGTTEPELLKGETTSVSRGGFSMLATREFHPGEILELELLKTDGPLFVASRVVYCHPLDAGQYVIGVQALETGPQAIISADLATAAQTYN
ncbi:MAG: PilZ domain-containing protein [Phycisphaerae bacterium]|nr:PilZ domain-containing protein [Phycisphaerae bacterium]